MLASLRQRITNLVRMYELFIDRIRLFVQDSVFVDFILLQLPRLFLVEIFSGVIQSCERQECIREIL